MVQTGGLLIKPLTASYKSVDPKRLISGRSLGRSLGTRHKQKVHVGCKTRKRSETRRKRLLRTPDSMGKVVSVHGARRKSPLV
jgi:hypothetical protein